MKTAQYSPNDVIELPIYFADNAQLTESGKSFLSRIFTNLKNLNALVQLSSDHHLDGGR